MFCLFFVCLFLGGAIFVLFVCLLFVFRGAVWGFVVVVVVVVVFGKGVGRRGRERWGEGAGCS